MKNIILFFLLVMVLSKWAEAKFLPNSFEATFEQVKVSRLTHKEKKALGTMVYQYPSQINFEIADPDKVVFVNNKVKSWYYTPPFIKGEEGQVQIQKSDKTGIVGFFDSLSAGLENNKFYTVKLNGNEAHLEFTPMAAKNIPVKKSILKFNKEAKSVLGMADIESIRLFYENKDDVVLNIKKIEQNKIYPETKFMFTIPDNTRVLK